MIKIIDIIIYKTYDSYKINQIDYTNKIIKKYNINKTNQLLFLHSVLTLCKKSTENDKNNSNLLNIKEIYIFY